MFNRLIVMCVLAALWGMSAMPASAQSEGEQVGDASEPIVIDQQMSLDTLDQKFCYMIGNDVGQFLNTYPMDVQIDVDAFLRGFNDGVEGQSAITQEQKMALSQMIQEAAERHRDRHNVAQAEQGQAHLRENAAREDVTVTDSGLQYRVVEAGDGPSPRAEDQVQVHYRGRLIDGTQFDSSYDRGQPATFGVTQVIAGWTEALMLMNKGAVWQITCPPDLAYGEFGAGGIIPPNAVLIFDIELLDIIPAADATDAGGATDAAP